MRDILVIAKRELKSIFTNKSSLVNIILVPFILIFLFVSMFIWLVPSTTENDNVNLNGYVINTPVIFQEAFVQVGLKTADLNNVETIQKQIHEGIADLLVVFPEDFALSMDPANVSNIEMWYNSQKTSSVAAQQVVLSILDSTRPVTFTVNAINPESYDLSGIFNIFQAALSTFMPIYALYSICLASLVIASTMIAGEKENGFMNLLLISPVKRHHIAFGKGIALLSANVCTTVVVMLAVFASTLFYKIMGQEVVNYSMADYASMFTLSLTGSFVITSVYLLISALSKTNKESSSRCSIILLFLAVCSIVQTMPIGTDIMVSLGKFYLFIPILNSIFLLDDVIQCSYSAMDIIIALAINLIVAFGLIFCTSRLFDNEKVMQS
jgi:ABC-type Na+ efflux pump permease subunit